MNSIANGLKSSNHPLIVGFWNKIEQVWNKKEASLEQKNAALSILKLYSPFLEHWNKRN